MFFQKVCHTDLPPPAASSKPLRIAVVGCGPAGIITIIALMRRLHRPFHAWMIDAAESPGAFGEGASGEARMNSPAGELSALADRPRDFALWLGSNMFATAAAAAIPGLEHIYAQRSLYRDYLMSRFAETLSDRPDVTLCVARHTVSTVAPGDGGFRLAFEDGECLDSDLVFLAAGSGLSNPEPAGWQGVEEWLAGRSGSGEPLLLAGDGPRMVAALLHLRSGGFGGPISVLSPKGLLPQPHARIPAAPAVPSMPEEASLRGIVRSLRRDCCSTMDAGGNWQSVMDGLALRIPALWKELSRQDRLRYRRHLEPYYRNHAVRIAPDLHRRLVLEFRSAATTLMRATLVSLVEGGAIVRLPTGETASLKGHVMDCREDTVSATEDLLVPFGCEGLSLDDQARVLKCGKIVPGLYVTGRAASALRPDLHSMTEIVRQIYRAVTGIGIRAEARQG
ncbi:MAG: FAD/NAD(P)-binding protein [Shinella sp.]|nr:FAD/NAD(P)-binding protein [Shinella sp.]